MASSGNLWTLVLRDLLKEADTTKAGWNIVCTLVLALCLASGLTSRVDAATFDVTYEADRYHAADSHTHESAEGFAERSTLGQIRIHVFNPDSQVGWTWVNGQWELLTLDFDLDCWYTQWATGTGDGMSSWHYWKADFGGSYLIRPVGGHTTTACNVGIN
jgi:hypothetical protein